MISYEVKADIVTLTEKGIIEKAVKLISWNSSPPKIDIRVWRQQEEGETPGKGVTLTAAEARTAANAIIEYLKCHPEIE